jgi:Domain of unknown function (DUF5655)/Domain of unknown function (DUF4287)
MPQKTSGEIEKELIEGLKEKTGRDLNGWLAAISASGNKKRNDLVRWLKEEHGFGHMNASLLMSIHANGGKPVYASTDLLLENQFAKAAHQRSLFDALTGFVKTHFPNAATLPKKTYVSILEKREFAALNIKPQELRIGLDLGDRPFDDTVAKAKLAGPMPRISHMFVLTHARQLDACLADLLRQSHGRSH